ncbi:hypothetical protein [Methylorubrum sp. SB2]|uniref:hypothetical protein n=1 Tax=Methylorubrum subtropicum TaxID=3138812 RepID=UPI00313CECDF
MGTVRIKMLRNDRGSEDGVSVKHYEREREYDVPTDFGQRFIDAGSAELVADLASNDNKPETPSQPSGKQPGTDGDATPVYVPGNVYDIDGHVCVAVEGSDSADDSNPTVGLLPVEQLTDEERKALVAEGKLTEDGKVPEAKAQPGAPENRAQNGAPQNKRR